MEFNTFVFPTPKSSYTAEEFKGELVWIPKKEHFSYRDKLRYNNYKSLIPMERGSMNSEMLKKLYVSTTSRKSFSSPSIVQKVPSISFSFDNKFQETQAREEVNYIPCLYIKSPEKKCNKVLIYFHANYEDLGYTYQIAASIAKYLKLNVLSVEYPGYGIYKTSNYCSSEDILKDANAVYKFLTEIMNVPESNILIMGRCIGSGPAIYLASNYNPLALLLISPIKSIKTAVKSIFDKLKSGWLIEKLVKDRYINVLILGLKI